MNSGLDDSAASGSLPAVVSNYLAASDRDDPDAVESSRPEFMGASSY